MGLHPRDLARPRRDVGGIGLDDFPERNHCLSCGDCVRACENVFEACGRCRAPLTLSRRLRSAGADGRVGAKDVTAPVERAAP